MPTKTGDQPIPVRVDSKGRVVIPRHIREEIDVKPGDTLFLLADGGVIQYAKPENPFEGLAADALRKNREGKTKDLGDIAAKWGVDLDVDDEE